MKSITHIYYDVKYGIKNLFKYFNIIWKDRNWDFEFTYELLQFKLNNVADNIEENKHHEGHERDVQRIRLCSRLIDVVLERDPVTKLIEQDMKNYDFLDGALNYKVREDYKEQYRILMFSIRDRGTKARRILFNIMDRHSLEWWD